MRIENKQQLNSLAGGEYDRALVALHHCDDATLRRIGLTRTEVNDLISKANINPPKLTIIGGPAPAPRASWTPREFLSKFTQQERINIRAAAKDDPIIEDYLDMLRTARKVFADDADTQAGLGLLAQKGLISQKRADDVLTWQVLASD